MTKKEEFYYNKGKKFIHSSFLLSLSESKDEKAKTEEEIIQSTIKAGKMAIEADAVYMVLEIKFDMQGIFIG